MKEESLVKIRKWNMKLFPFYKTLSWDYIFFYTINFLFLTQVKGINAADVVLIESFYNLFAIIAQFPATFIIEFLGRKNSIVLANILSCLYMVVIIFSNNLFNLIIAEILSALAFAIKSSAEPSLLNESIPDYSKKDQIFAKISSKGLSLYYIINAFSIVISGILYEINPYIPIILSLCTLVIVSLISLLFIEPVQKKKANTKNMFKQFSDLSDAFRFILKSERLKGLLLFSSIMFGLISILTYYEVSLLESLNVSAKYLGIIFAFLGLVSAFSAKRQEKFHNKFTNKSLSILGGISTFCCILIGIFGIITEDYPLCIFIIILFYIINFFIRGIFHPLIEKYLRNFTNEEIDTKIYIANNFFKGIFSAISGIFASFLLNRMEISICMILIGIIFGIIIFLVSIFMKKRVGLNPSKYSKEEIKYDTLK